MNGVVSRPADTGTSTAEIADIVGQDDIECECMLCHLPFGEPHPPIEWRYTVRFPGPYPEPGESTMLWYDGTDTVWRILHLGRT